MSVEPIDRKSGRVWRVRWRDESGRARSRVLGRKQDAVAFDAEVKRRKRTGNLESLTERSVTLAEFVEEWWTRYAKPNLAERTLRSYAGTWDRHVLPYLGERRLDELTPDLLEDWVADLRGRGVGEPTIGRALVVLSSVLARAAAWGRLANNPVAHVTKPKPERQVLIRPLTREQVTQLMDATWRPVDRFIIALMAYAGLRPQELMALTWDDMTLKHIKVDKAVERDEGTKSTKTGKNRLVKVSDDLRTEILRYMADTPSPSSDDSPLIQRRGGRHWNDGSWQTWHRDVWRPVTKECGIQARPYDLRHTFVSQLIHDGASVVEVAKQAGHSPVMTLSRYAHVFDEAA